MSIEAKEIKLVSVSSLKENPRNRNLHGSEQIAWLAKIIEYNGFRNPLIVSNQSGYLAAGHGRLRAAKLLNMDLVPVIYQDFKDMDQEIAYGIADNAIARQAELDFSGINLDLAELGPDFNVHMLGIPNFVIEPADNNVSDNPSLRDRFLIPPFSVLDARQGYWKERKQKWLAMGIRSEVGRGDNLLGMSDTMLEPDPSKRRDKTKAINTTDWVKSVKGDDFTGLGAGTPGGGTSVFDPVLCELVYRWFSPKGGTVLDPFAGGSVRGIVAAKLGRIYFGGDLRSEQIEANEIQARTMLEPTQMPTWKAADSKRIHETFPDVQADLVFSCPPYADLEVYSDDPRDISTMEYGDFMDAYREIIKKSLSLLKKDRFAVFVVGEVREKKGGGFYKNFVQDTIKAFEVAGAKHYNEMILLTSAGSLALRAGRTFAATRKIGKTHQNVIVFCKGDPRKAADACGVVDMAELSEYVEEEN